MRITRLRAALPRIVQPSSERTLDPVRRNSSFAEKQESHLTRLLAVRSGRSRPELGDLRLNGERRSAPPARGMTAAVFRRHGMGGDDVSAVFQTRSTLGDHRQP